MLHASARPGLVLGQVLTPSKQQNNRLEMNGRVMVSLASIALLCIRHARARFFCDSDGEVAHGYSVVKELPFRPWVLSFAPLR